MSDAKWVQHISGQGEKWEVSDNKELSGMWVLDRRIGGLCPCVPKSEYVPCDPPEVWENVSEHIEPSPVSGNWRNAQNGDTALGVSEPDYRLRKVPVTFMVAGPRDEPGHAFIVERRKA